MPWDRSHRRIAADLHATNSFRSFFKSSASAVVKLVMHNSVKAMNTLVMNVPFRLRLAVSSTRTYLAWSEIRHDTKTRDAPAHSRKLFGPVLAVDEVFLLRGLLSSHGALKPNRVPNQQ
jgi:hypothetical protein